MGAKFEYKTAKYATKRVCKFDESTKLWAPLAQYKYSWSSSITVHPKYKPSKYAPPKYDHIESLGKRTICFKSTK